MSTTRTAGALSATLLALLLSACGNDSEPAATAADSEVPAQPAAAITGPVSALIANTPLLNGGAPAAPGIRLPQLPLNALEALLSLPASQLAATQMPVTLPEAGQATPRAECDADSQPLDGVQGRVTQADINSPEAARGWRCNLKQVGHHRTPGGWRVWRYTDAGGRTCAYYDTSFMAPLNIIKALAGPSLGVAVLDMTDPTRPVHTDTLTSMAMLSPHESLNLSTRRGLLAATTGNALTRPGSMAIYDVSKDCRHPELLAEKPILFGHESGFSPDGNTFWAAGGAGYILAIDVSEPRRPEVLWRGAYYAHGLSLSDDGNTLYHTDPINGNLGILDVSEIQNRQLNPRVREISRVTWPSVSIPQSSTPFSVNGNPYLLEFDEFAFRFNPVTIDSQVGAARIIDLAQPEEPRIVSSLRLAVNQRDAHREAATDPSPLPPTQVFGYSFHYCAVPQRENPGIAACSAMNSGLRVFDIRDPARPREVAYFIAPPKAGGLLGLLPGNLATSQPAFVPERREIWYTDASSGFYVLRLSPAAWPQ